MLEGDPAPEGAVMWLTIDANGWVVVDVAALLLLLPYGSEPRVSAPLGSDPRISRVKWRPCSGRLWRFSRNLASTPAQQQQP